MAKELSKTYDAKSVENRIYNECDRLLESRPTIISTNLSEEDLVRRYNPQIASRLRGSYRRVAFVGEDIRLLKSKGVIK